MNVQTLSCISWIFTGKDPWIRWNINEPFNKAVLDVGLSWRANFDDKEGGIISTAINARTR
jgi:hypothetical protein